MLGTPRPSVYALLCALTAFAAAESVFANSLAIFRTTFGEMALELYDDDKPNTVRNFMRLTELGRYSNSIVHVCAPGLIIQGGGYYTTNALSTNTVTALSPVPPFGVVSNEFSRGRIYSNVFGTISMAKIDGFPDSATTQWFINLGDNSSAFDNTNGGYTVFGKVIADSGVLAKFNTMSNGYGTINGGGPFFALPVTFNGIRAPQYTELVYAGTELLKTSTTLQPDGARLVEWNSPSTMVCRVEYSDSGVNGPWDTLHLTNGNGLIQSTTDTNIFTAARVYRIRVE